MHITIININKISEEHLKWLNNQSFHSRNQFRTSYIVWDEQQCVICVKTLISDRESDLFISVSAVNNVTSSKSFFNLTIIWCEILMQILLRGTRALWWCHRHIYFHFIIPLTVWLHAWRHDLSCFLWFASGGLAVWKVVSLIAVRAEKKQRGGKRGKMAGREIPRARGSPLRAQHLREELRGKCQGEKGREVGVGAKSPTVTLWSTASVGGNTPHSWEETWIRRCSIHNEVVCVRESKSDKI